MTLTPVKTLPVRKNRHYNRLIKLLKEFSESNYEIARVDYNSYEYDEPYTLYSSLYRAIPISKRPIKLRMVNGEVYLLKR